MSDDLLCIHHGLSESGTVPAPSAAPPDVLYDKRNSKTFGTEDQRQNLSPVAGEYRGCDMFSDPCRRHNRYGICTGTSRISGDRTGTEIVPVLFCVYDEPSTDLCLHKNLYLANEALNSFF